MLNCIISKGELIEKNYSSSIGYIYAGLFGLVSCTTSLLIKLLPLSPHTILFYRSFFMTIIGYTIMNSIGVTHVSKNTKLNKMMISRAVIGIMASGFTYYGLKFLPLSEWIIIHQTTPVITASLAPIFLNEKFEKISIVTLTFSMLGIILIAKPPFIFGGNSSHTNVLHHIIGVIASIGGACLNSFVELLIKALGQKTNSLAIVFYFSVVGILYSSVILMNEEFKYPTLQNYILVIIMGSISYLGHVFKTRSMIFGKVARISMMGYLQIVISYMFDIFIFNFLPDVWSIMGSILIVSCVLLLLFHK